MGAAAAVLALDMAGGWDLHPDGDRFIVAVPEGRAAGATAAESAEAPRYLVVLNWFEELKQRIGND